MQVHYRLYMRARAGSATLLAALLAPPPCHSKQLLTGHVLMVLCCAAKKSVRVMGIEAQKPKWAGLGDAPASPSGDSAGPVAEGVELQPVSARV